jgi:hypothetical protein
MSSIQEEKLKTTILDLEEQITDHKNKLFMYRLCKLLCKTEQQIKDANITNLNIFIDDDVWDISYIHTTNDYNSNDYNFDIESEDESDVRLKISNVHFGKAKKYYIKGNGIRQSRFKLYKNSRKDLRIINTDYDIELDMDEQFELIGKYSENKNIPEWLAIKVFLHICENEWQDQHIINYLGTV